MYNSFILDDIKRTYLGKRIRVSINDPWHPIIDAEGIVESVDDMGQLHGTWCGLAAIPEVDAIEILN